MEWCVDANIVVKAVTKEDFSEKEIALMSDALNMEMRLIAPHFFDAETNGAVRKKVYRGSGREAAI
jgi:predicted nucleic acid-binding protein